MTLFGPMTAGRWLGALVIAVLLLVALAVIVFRDDIFRSALDPEIPFQTYEPPPAPDYAEPSAWALLGQVGRDEDGAAVFFVHPTTYDGDRHWNAPIDDASADAFLTRAMLPNYVGPFLRTGRVFAPRYRQASLYTRFTRRDDAREARAFAYRDIAAAFDAWLARYDEGGPFVIAGVEQGAELAVRLLDERIAGDPALRDRLVAAYAIDAVVPADLHEPEDPIPACRSRDQAGCLVAWAQAPERAEMQARERLERALVWGERGRLTALGEREALCVNPVTGAATEREISEREHLGGANATGLEWGARPAFLSRQVATQCRDGLLRYSTPPSRAFERSGSWADRQKAYPYNLFYADIEADVAARLDAWRAGRGAGTP